MADVLGMTTVSAVSGGDDSFTPLSLVDKTLKISWGLIGVVGTLANAFVIFVFLRVPSLRSITNLFLVNQSLLDVFSSVILVAMKFIPPTWPLRFGVFNDFICKVWVSEYLMQGAVVSSTMNLVCVSLERYLAIVHPIFHRKHFTETKAKVVIGFVWMWGYGCELIWLAVNNEKDGFCIMIWPSVTFQEFFGFFFITIIFLLPVSLMTYAYLRMFSSLRRKNPAFAATSMQENDPRTAAMGKASRNIIKTLATVFVVYFICWLPEQVMFFQFCIGLPIDLTGINFNITMILVNCNMIVNPFIYTLQYREFRKGIKKAFGVKSNVAPLQTNRGTVGQGTGTATSSIGRESSVRNNASHLYTSNV